MITYFSSNELYFKNFLCFSKEIKNRIDNFNNYFNNDGTIADMYSLYFLTFTTSSIKTTGQIVENSTYSSLSMKGFLVRDR